MLIIKKSSLQRSVYILLGFFYASILALIPHELFRDRANYLKMIEYSDFFLELKADSTLVSSELGFAYLNKFISSLIKPEYALSFYVFLINYILCIFFLSKSKNFILAFVGLISFSLLPMGFSYQLGSIRQSLAVSIILIATIYFNSYKKIFIAVFLSGLIHTSAWILLPFYTLDYFFLKSYKQNRLWLRLFWHTTLALIIAITISTISQFFDISKLDNYLALESQSGLFFIYFIPILIYNIYTYYLEKKADNVLITSILGIIIYLIFYFLTPIAGRMITLFIPFIYLSLVRRFTPLNMILLSYTLIIGIYFYSIAAYKVIMTI